MQIATGMVAAGLALALMVPGVHAQTHGRMDDGGMKSQQMMGPRMMHQGTMRDMQQMTHRIQKMMGELNGVMERTQERLQDRTGDGDQLRQQDRERLRDMARLMDELGASIRTMAQHMNQGEMDPQARERVRSRLDQMERMLQRLQEGTQ